MSSYTKYVVLLFVILVSSQCIAVNKDEQVAPTSPGHRSPPGAEPYFGYHTHLSRTVAWDNEFAQRRELLAAVRSGGGGFIRTGFPWKAIEPKKGKMDWEVFDDLVTVTRQNDIQILGVLHALPEWVADPQHHQDDWRHFVGQVITRYGENVDHWEIWNEPNLERYWPRKAGIEIYTDYVKIAAEVIKEHDPDDTVLLGGLACGGEKKQDSLFQYWEKLFKRDVLEFCDGIAFHPYRYPGIKLISLYNRLTKTAQKYTDRTLEYWITEFGVNTREKNGSATSPKLLNLQVRDILQTAICFKAIGGKRFIIFELIDPGRNHANQFLGVLDHERGERPAHTAVAWLAGIFGHYLVTDSEVIDTKTFAVQLRDDSGNTAYLTWGRQGYEWVQKHMPNNTQLIPTSFDKEYSALTSDGNYRPAFDEDTIIFWQ